MVQSKINSQCQQCNSPIEIGDEIIRVANGIWAHEQCENPQQEKENNEISNEEKFTRNLLESKIERERTVNCVSCNGNSFLKPKLETMVLDDGDTLTKKIFICHNCSYIMQFVEKMDS